MIDFLLWQLWTYGSYFFLVSVMYSSYGCFCFWINIEKKGEHDYGIVFEWFWEGETKLSNFSDGIIVIVYNTSFLSLSVNSTLSIVCIFLFVANVSAINKSQFLQLNCILVPVSIRTILKNVFLKCSASEWTCLFHCILGVLITGLRIY